MFPGPESTRPLSASAAGRNAVAAELLITLLSTASTIFLKGSAGAQTPLLCCLAISFGPEEVFIAHGSSLPATKGENYTRVCVFVSVTELRPRARFREVSEMVPQSPAPVSQRKPAPGESQCLLPC